jgi:hypothetical protein
VLIALLLVEEGLEALDITVVVIQQHLVLLLSVEEEEELKAQTHSEPVEDLVEEGLEALGPIEQVALVHQVKVMMAG